MPNSIVGINDDIISQSILEGFVAELTPLNAFSTNFSADAAKKGDKVSVLRTLAADVAITKVSHTAYVIQDADSDAVEIVLGQPVHVSYSLDDVEIASSSMLNMETFGIQKGAILAEGVLTNIWGAITAANYGGAAYGGAINAFSSDTVMTVRGVATAAKMPRAGRSLILDDALITALLQTTEVQDASAFGERTPLIEGAISRLGGFNIFESILIPTNGEGLNGFAVHPAGLAVAMRYLQPQEGNKYHRAEALTSENGITIGLRDWYDENSGERKRVYECVFGKVVGIAAGIKRITAT